MPVERQHKELISFDDQFWKALLGYRDFFFQLHLSNFKPKYIAERGLLLSMHFLVPPALDYTCAYLRVWTIARALPQCKLRWQQLQLRMSLCTKGSKLMSTDCTPKPHHPFRKGSLLWYRVLLKYTQATDSQCQITTFKRINTVIKWFEKMKSREIQ